MFIRRVVRWSFFRFITRYLALIVFLYRFLFLEPAKESLVD